MSGFSIGQRIADPRVLSEELGGDTVPDMYSSLANYTFGSPRPPSLPSERLPESTEFISPLTTLLPRLGSDRTPRPSVAPHSTSSPFHSVSSHPSQFVGLSASSSSQPRRNSASRDSSPNTSGTRSGSDSERSLDPIPSPDPIIAAFSRSQRGGVMPDNASQHTFGHTSRAHGVTAASSRDGATPSSSSASVTTSRSSSRASMRSTEQFSSDDELEIDYYDGGSSPVTFARDYLVDIDEDMDLSITRPSLFHSSRFDTRRGSLPMAIPGALKSNDSHSARSREGSILTVRRPSRSWDESSVHRSSHSVEDPTIVLPKSEPLPRAGRLSLEVQLQGKSQQVEASAYDGLDLTYILPKRSEGSIRSFNSHLSFLQAGASSHHRSSLHLPGLALASTSTLQFEDSFTRHLQKHDRTYDADRYYWSFQREKADASNTSSRRRRQAHPHSNAKPAKEPPSRVQEMWRCGHVGRFKVDRLAFKPQSADPGKAAQQRIQIRHIPDPYLMGNTITGPHSVIHKHSRAIAFSIFRSHGLFSGGRHAGGTGTGHSGPPTHMNMRSGTMLALKKVQEQYTSTKTTRQLGPFQSGDRKLEKGDKGKGKGRTKATSKGRGKDKGDKKHRPRPTESAESSTATSSAGSVAHSAIRHVTSAPERPTMRVQFSPRASPPTTIHTYESLHRPVSSMSLLSTSADGSIKVPESEPSPLSPILYHQIHRDSIDSEDRLPTRTTHAEAFSSLDPNDIESLRSKPHSRTHPDSSSTIERLLRVFRSGPKTDDHSLFSTRPGAFQPPWLTTAGRDQQEENDRVLDDLNASFRDVGLLPNPHKPPKSSSKQKSRGGVLDQIPDDCLYMLLPLWPGETDAGGVRDEASSTASFVTAVENRQFLLVHYVPFSEGSRKDKKPEKKKAKQSHSSDSGIESENKFAYLPTFRVVARVVAYDELRLSNIRIPSDGLAISGPEWEAISYPPSTSSGDQVLGTVVCHCDGREGGFNFVQHGLMSLGLAMWEEPPPAVIPHEEDVPIPQGKMILTPIGRAAVEMIWLGCLAITSFGPA